MKIANKLIEALKAKDIKELQDALEDAIKFDGESLLSMEFTVDDWESVEGEDSSGNDTSWDEPSKASAEFKVSELIQLVKDIASDEDIAVEEDEIKKLIPKLAGSLKGVEFNAIDLVKREWSGDLEIKKINQRGNKIIMELDVSNTERR